MKKSNLIFIIGTALLIAVSIAVLQISITALLRKQTSEDLGSQSENLNRTAVSAAPHHLTPKNSG